MVADHRPLVYTDSEYPRRLIEAMRYGILNVKNGYSDSIHREAFWWAEQWGLDFGDVSHILDRALTMGITALAQDAAQECAYARARAGAASRRQGIRAMVGEL